MAVIKEKTVSAYFQLLPKLRSGFLQELKLKPLKA